jgi:hypothetical protein
MGICHGGALSTLADIAAATGVNVASERQGGTPTINLAMDFISSARMGQWIQADLHLVTVKRRFGFSSGAIISADGVVARFNGTFYLPEHKGMVKPEMAHPPGLRASVPRTHFVTFSEPPRVTSKARFRRHSGATSRKCNAAGGPWRLARREPPISPAAALRFLERSPTFPANRALLRTNWVALNVTK